MGGQTFSTKGAAILGGGAGALSSGACGGAGGRFQSVVVVAPPVLVGVREVAVLLEQSGRAVDQFADDVGVTGVPLGFRGHVDEDMVQRHLAVLSPPELDQPQEVGAGRGKRSTDVILAEPVQLPQQRLPGALKIVTQVFLASSPVIRPSMPAGG